MRTLLEIFKESSTLNGMKEVLIAQSSSFDIFVNVYIGGYGQYAQEILNSNRNGILNV